MEFTNNVRVLLVPQPDDRPLDQYLAFRDTVLALVQSPQFLKDLDDEWGPFTDYPKHAIGQALLMELKAFSHALEVVQAMDRVTPEPERKPWWKKLLGRASTATGSVKDLFENLPSHVKGGLTLLKELIDLFRGGE
jgi:hypothetical protein